MMGLLTSSLFAQNIQVQDQEATKTRISNTEHITNYKSGNTFWEEDFSNGWPTGWTTQNSSGLCEWKWTLGGTHGFFNGNNATDFDDPISSTTAADGFIIADNDSANHFNFGQPSSQTYEFIDTRFTTSAIDLSANPAVVLEFEQMFRFNNDVDLEVSVSNDSITWTTWTVQGNAVNNGVSADPELVELNITSVAGGEATVYIRVGWNARVYFWMIDDMRIIQAPDNDIKILRSDYNEWDFDTSPDFSTLEFSMYSSSQVRPLTFKTLYNNFGTVDQTNVSLNVDVLDDGNNNVFNGASAGVTAPTEIIDSLYVLGYTPSGATGRFDIMYEITQDQTDSDPSDNASTRWFDVSEFIFARDTGALDGNTDNQNEAYELGNWYNIQNNDEELAGIDVVFDDDTEVGTIVSGVLYDSNRDVIDFTEEYEIQSSDLNAAGENNSVSLVFASPITLFQDEDYLITVSHFGGADNVVIGTSGDSPPQTSLIFDQPTSTWFFVTSTPMVRMNFNPSVGIEDDLQAFGMSVGQNIPNPSNGSTSIRIEFDQAMQSTFEMHDVTGKLVYFQDLGKRSAGLHTIQLNTNEFNNGLYFYTLIANDQKMTKRMVVLN